MPDDPSPIGKATADVSFHCGLAELLIAVGSTGSVSQAAAQVGISYKSAVAMLKEGEERLGFELFSSQPGPYKRLSSASRRMTKMDRRYVQRPGFMDDTEVDVPPQFAEVRVRTPGELRVAAGQGFSIEPLVVKLRECGVVMHHTYAGCIESLVSLRDGSCDLAGLHIPADDMQWPVVAAYQEHLHGMDLALIEVTTHRLGLMVAPWNPKNVFSPADLSRAEVRFVNRQSGSGTRLLFQSLLDKQSIQPETITGFSDFEYTHAAVAAYVSSGVADAGFGLESVARQFGLDFVPMTNERYFFVCCQETLLSPELDMMRVLLRTLGHSATAQVLPTDDGLEALGEVFGLVSCFPPET